MGEMSTLPSWGLTPVAPRFGAIPPGGPQESSWYSALRHIAFVTAVSRPVKYSSLLSFLLANETEFQLLGVLPKEI